MKFLLLLFCSMLISNGSFSQNRIITSHELMKTPFWNSIEKDKATHVESFFNAFEGFIWTVNPSLRTNLQILLENRTSYGIELQKSEIEYILGIQNGTVKLITHEDSILAELRFTIATFHLFSELVLGKKPAFAYEGLILEQDHNTMIQLLIEKVKKNSLQHFTIELNWRLPEIRVMLKKLKEFLSFIHDPAFTEAEITSTRISAENKSLTRKLYHRGYLDSPDVKMEEGPLLQVIKKFQYDHNLYVDGRLGNFTLRELNTSLYTRVEQLKYSLGLYRWLAYHTMKNEAIVVNIPAAYLKVYQDTSIILQMRMVVGAPRTPTPTLISKVKEVILYPYWMVPRSIATKELLPAVKRDRTYLDRNGFQVINKSGYVVDHNRINWSQITASNLPYIFRQSTGCDNSLGLIKLNFDNPFSVYLHDTPSKSTFLLQKRFYSHGCMRMEKPMELAHLILKYNPQAIDTIEQKGCLRNQAPISIEADVAMTVIVWYNPVALDATGNLVFYDDVYRRFNWTVHALPDR